MRLSIALFAFAFCLTTTSVVPTSGAEPKPNPGTRIVAYLPDYRIADYDLTRARHVTDLIIFAASPTPDGQLDLTKLRKSANWEALKAFKTQGRIRLILCVGGWHRSEHFAVVAGSAEKRNRFVTQAVQLCLNDRLDGLDLDWEHPKNAAEQSAYAALLTDLRQAFQKHGLVLSVTIAGWQKLSLDAYASVDTVNLMAYDHQGRHSTFEGTQADIKALLEQGVPPSKIVLGLPFYGRHITKRDQVMTYREIIAKHKLAPEVDEVEGIYFNGPTTIRRKLDSVLQSKLGGAMIWELGQDAPGNESLLKIVTETLGNR